MKAMEEQSGHPATQAEGRSAEEVAALAREEARKKAYAAQEQKIPGAVKARTDRDPGRR